ncbi:MAG TPA: class II aldolase [Armatimonadetes bacterium]|nr:class II aldolase [Armatimonadota bacterium]
MNEVGREQHKHQILEQLVQMSCYLGAPGNEYVVLGEGNTSAKIDERTFYVKASGVSLTNITSEGFVEVYSEPVLEMLKYEHLSDDEIQERLMDARVDPNCPYRPSVETVFHAMLLQLPNINFVGHTHPTALNSILCAKRSREPFMGHLFPEGIVCCGIAPVYVEYADPGVTLAKAIQRGVQEHLDTYGEPPKSILLENHGLIALGANPKEVETVTIMWDKIAKILLGTYMLGGPRFLTEEQVNRIWTRPDEKYRQKLIFEREGEA